MIIFNPTNFYGIIFNFMGKILFRIQKIAQKEGITIGTLEKQIGASKGVLSRAINNGTDIQSKWIQKLVENYPNYSADWLLTGNGNMLKTPMQECHILHEEKSSYNVNRRNEVVNLYDIHATAGFFETYGESTPIDSLYLPNIPHADGAIFAIGESMQPVINNGDIIVFRIINDTKHIHWGEIYIVSYNDRGDHYTCVKRLQPSEDGKIQLISINSNYTPINIPADTITHLALVVASVSIKRFTY